MAKTNNLNDFLTDIANTIRTKKGTTAPINAQDFSSEIESISGGGISGGYNISFSVDGVITKVISITAGDSIANNPFEITKTGSTFDGWSETSGGSLITYPYTPTGDITLYAKFTLGGYDFANDSWSVIAQQIKAGTDHYQLGATKTDTITVGGSSYSAVFKIVDDKVGRYKTQSGVSHKVIEMQRLTGTNTTSGVMWNSSATSFANSNLFSWLNSTGILQLPADLQAVLETTTVYSGPGNATASSTNIVSATGKLFSPCMNEYYGDNESYNYATKYETRNTQDGLNYGQYTWYKQQGVSTSSYSALVKGNLTSSTDYYWTRSPYDSSYAVYVSYSGKRNSDSYTSTGFRACFCFAW